MIDDIRKTNRERSGILPRERALIALHQRGRRADQRLLRNAAAWMLSIAESCATSDRDSPTPAELWHRAIAGFRKALHAKRWNTSRAVPETADAPRCTAAAFRQAAEREVRAALQKPGAMPKRKQERYTFSDLRAQFAEEVPQPLSDDETRDAVRAARTGSLAGHALFLRRHDFGARVAMKYRRYVMPIDEAEQMGRIAYWESFAYQDLSRGASPASYGWWHVRNALTAVNKQTQRRRTEPYVENANIKDEELDERGAIVERAVHPGTGAHDMHAPLARMLERLPKRQSEALWLRFVEGLTLEETATELEVSLSTAKRDLQQALHSARRMLGHCDDDR